MKPAPATDSPWFWMAAFAFVGLVWLAAFGPKYARRQENLERRYEARLEIARRQAAGEPLGEPNDRNEPAHEHADDNTTGSGDEGAPRGLLMPLEPLVFVLAGVLEFAVWRLLASAAAGQPTAPVASPAPQQTGIAGSP